MTVTDKELSLQWQLREQAEYEVQRWKKEFNRRGDEIIVLEDRLRKNTAKNPDINSNAVEDYEREIDQLRSEITAERRKFTELLSELECTRMQLNENNRKLDQAEAKCDQVMSQLRASEDEVANLSLRLRQAEINCENERRLMEVDCSAKADLIESLTSQITSLNLRHADELKKVGLYVIRILLY
jgi:chromosome segregation ATPase